MQATWTVRRGPARPPDQPACAPPAGPKPRRNRGARDGAVFLQGSACPL